jgi:CRP-like cAMP-binding protein
MISIDKLRMNPIFTGLLDVELAGVPHILRRRAYTTGAYIYYPGNPGLHSNLAESGLIRLFIRTASGHELILKLIGPQEIFGLLLLNDEQVRLIGAVTHRPAVLYSIARKDFLWLMEGSLQFMGNIYQTINSDARRLLLYLRSIVTLNLNDRLAAILLRLSKKNEDHRYILFCQVGKLSQK